MSVHYDKDRSLRHTSRKQIVFVVIKVGLVLDKIKPIKKVMDEIKLGSIFGGKIGLTVGIKL